MGADAQISMEVIPSPAPVLGVSPSTTGYITNALHSIENGLGTTGDPDVDPTAYETVTEAPSGYIILTSGSGGPFSS